MDYLEVRQIYKDSVLDFAKGWGVELTDHQIDTMVSVMIQRDGIHNGGSFVDAVVNNDLYNAISRADSENLANLKLITLCYRNNHLRTIPTINKQAKSQIAQLVRASDC